MNFRSGAQQRKGGHHDSSDSSAEGKIAETKGAQSMIDLGQKDYYTNKLKKPGYSNYLC